MIRQAVKWLVYSNVWISFNVSCLVYYGSTIGLLRFHPVYILLSFFATLFAYNVQRLMKLGRVNPKKSERHVWITQHQSTIKILTVISFLACVTGTFLLYDIVMLYLGAPGLILVMLYAGVKKEGLRSVPWLKIFLISTVWLVVAAVLPKVLFHERIESVDAYYFFAIWSFVFAVCLPFDIRDLETDKGVVKTIPSLIGIPATKWMCGLFLMIPLIFGVTNYSYGIVLVSLTAIILCFNTSIDKRELYYTGLIDGLFCLLPLTEILIKYADKTC